MNTSHTVVATFTAPTASPTPSPIPSARPSPSSSAAPAAVADVPARYWTHGQIAIVAARGITTGCRTDPATGARYYCPDKA